MNDLIPAAVPPEPGDHVQAGDVGQYAGIFLMTDPKDPAFGWILLEDESKSVIHAEAKFVFVMTERTVEILPRISVDAKVSEWSGPLEHAHTDLPSGLYYATSTAADGEHKGTLAVGLTNEVWICGHNCPNVDAHRRGEVG